MQINLAALALRFAPPPVAKPALRAPIIRRTDDTLASLASADAASGADHRPVHMPHRTYRAALRVPYNAPLATLADACGGSFTINDLIASGIAKPAPVAMRNQPMPEPYAIPSHTKPFYPKRDGNGSLSQAKLIYAGLSPTRESLFTIA